jgi:hypothetical protein
MKKFCLLALAFPIFLGVSNCYAATIQMEIVNLTEDTYIAPDLGAFAFGWTITPNPLQELKPKGDYTFKITGTPQTYSQCTTFTYIGKNSFGINLCLDSTGFTAPICNKTCSVQTQSKDSYRINIGP